MTVTIDGITYQGTPDEIRIIVENPPVINRRPQEWGDKDTDDGAYPWTPVIPNDPWKTPRFPGNGFPYPGYPINGPITCTMLY